MTNETAPAADQTFQLWKAINEAAEVLPSARDSTPIRRDESAALALPRHLRYLLEEADLTKLWDLPLDRAVRRVLAECVLDQQTAQACVLPGSGALDRVLIVKSGGMHVLRRLIDQILVVRQDAVLYVLCHERDVESIVGLWPTASIHPLTYPHDGPFDPAVLSRVIADQLPALVATAFYLDNNPRGVGGGVEHVEAGLATRPFARVYLFNAGEGLYDTHTLRASDNGLNSFVQGLLEWWGRRSAYPETESETVYTSDDVWEAVARQEPHWGVCSVPRFKKAQLTEPALEEFFADGERMIESYLSKIRQVEPGFQPRRALDFGCGVGRLTRALARRVDHVDALDISETMRRLCAETCAADGLSNVSVLPSDRTLTALDGRARVDLAVSSIVMQHIHQSEGLGLLRRLVHQLAPGGWGVFYILFGHGIPETARPVFEDLQNLPAKIEMNDYDLNAVFHEVEQHCDFAFQTFSRQGDRRGVDLYCRRKPVDKPGRS